LAPKKLPSASLDTYEKRESEKAFDKILDRQDGQLLKPTPVSNIRSIRESEARGSIGSKIKDLLLRASDVVA